MSSIYFLSDADLLTRMPVLVLAERAAIADVVEHLIEIDRRRLYLDQACGSLQAYCMERLRYSEDAAYKRVRVARLAREMPRVLDELRSGAIHLTGLFVLAPHLNEANAEALLMEARGKSRSELEQMIARWFPKPACHRRLSRCWVRPAGTGVGVLLIRPPGRPARPRS